MIEKGMSLNANNIKRSYEKLLEISGNIWTDNYSHVFVVGLMIEKAENVRPKEAEAGHLKSSYFCVPNSCAEEPWWRLSIDDVTYKRLFIDWKIIANRVAIDFELTFLELREAFYQTNNVAVSVTRLADFSVKISY